MYAAVLALFSVVGAWMAWRRNPSYTTRSTIRSLLVAALAIAGLIGLIVVAVNFATNRSAPVAYATMATVIVVGSLAMIFILQAASTPKDAKLTTALPASAKILHVHRQQVYHWSKVFAVIIAVCGVLALLIPGDAKYIPLTFGGMALLLATIMLPVLYATTRTADRSLTALELNPWVHWRYTPAQWQQWTEVQVGRMKAAPPTFLLKRDWHKLAWAFGVIAAGVGIFSPGTWLEKGLYVICVCGGIYALVMFSARSEHRMPEKTAAKLGKIEPEVYFGHDGLYCDGGYLTWLGLSVYLVAASVDTHAPRSLLFDFEKVIPNPYGATVPLQIHQSVLIPEGADADIARLQHELTGRCPKAQILLA
jgi:hypothetical protein